MKLRWAIAALLVLISAGLAFVARLGAPSNNPAELSKRCTESRPAWASYQEDIKGQVGAQPVARWQGKLVDLRQEAGLITATFALESPWAEWEADVPVLMRDPMGHEYRQDGIDRDGSIRRYRFHLDPADASSILPWVDIHFPHTERRIALGTGGHWSYAAVKP